MVVSAREALQEASVRHVNGYGSLNLFNRVDKRQAKIYLMDANVYAAEIIGYEPPLVERLKWVFKESIDLEDVYELWKRTNPENRLRYALLRDQIINAETSNSISRDFFINLADDILSWADVKSSWKEGDSLDTQAGYQIRPAKTSDLLAALTKKESSITNFCNDFDIDVTQLGGVYILPNREAYSQDWDLRVDSDNYVRHVVKNAKDAIAMKDITAQANVFGLFNLISSVHGLYEKGLVNYNVNGRVYSNLKVSQEQILTPQSQQPAQLSEESETIPVTPEEVSLPERENVVPEVPQAQDSPQSAASPEQEEFSPSGEVFDEAGSLNGGEPENIEIEAEDIGLRDLSEDAGTENLEAAVGEDLERGAALLPEMPVGDFSSLAPSLYEDSQEEEIEENDLDSLIKNIRMATMSLSKQIKASEEREKELEDIEQDIVRKISELEQARESATHELEAQKKRTMDLEIKLSRIRSPLN